MTGCALALLDYVEGNPEVATRAVMQADAHFKMMWPSIVLEVSVRCWEHLKKFAATRAEMERLGWRVSVEEE